MMPTFQALLMGTPEQMSPIREVLPWAEITVPKCLLPCSFICFTASSEKCSFRSKAEADPHGTKLEGSPGDKFFLERKFEYFSSVATITVRLSTDYCQQLPFP